MALRMLAALVLAGLSFMACGPDKAGEQGRLEPAPRERVAPSTVPDGGAEAAEAAEPAEPAGRRLRGTAIVDDDGGVSPAGRVELVIGDGHGPVSGTMELDGKTIALEGIIDEEYLRLWAVSDKGDPRTVRRGFVMGRTTPSGTLAGEFALSDSGGAWSVRGTWKTAD